MDHARAVELPLHPKKDDAPQFETLLVNSPVDSMRTLSSPARTDTDATVVEHYNTAAAKLDSLALAPTPTISDSKTVYNIYHKKERRHFVVTPHTSEFREKFCGPRTKKESKLAKVDFQTGHYYLHQPCLSFHDPPRILRRGNSKHSTPICIINNSFLWKRWKLQFGTQLANEGVIDPRGVVSKQYALKSNDEFGVKGYGVRSWRMFGESGKDYHRKVNGEKGNLRPTTNGSEMTTNLSSPSISSKTNSTEPVSESNLATLSNNSGTAAVSTGPIKPLTAQPSILSTATTMVGADQTGPARIIDEVVYLDWTAPLSTKTRRYHFQYKGIDFYWVGTGTVKEQRSWGWMLRFHHLKLVARTSLRDHIAPEMGLKNTNTSDTGLNLSSKTSEPTEYRDVCLGKYTSSLAAEKAGTLELYDAAIRRFAHDSLESSSDSMPDPQAGREERNSEEEVIMSTSASATPNAISAPPAPGQTTLQGTRLYDIIIATSLCMLIGEQQKRQTLAAVLEVGAAGGDAGG
ncbi:hypothetical protein K402DRAFT_388378 [Aulographum hederae CBS 113979]|uniref:Uncharacterized protein n=1 Tax=Aulographum hederae CBS 113979 TaxID=1176131 RepID=A0A6G1HFA2_9PEZI|nr:hypothetical protein K402DRAFT_388378 [Aulographum hederae CBS 113979]